MAISTLVAPLKTSLVLGKGTGSPSFTRATEAIMYPDNEGKAITAPAGCVRFSGARLVRNLTRPLNEWNTQETGLGTIVGRTVNYAEAPAGGVTAYRLQLSLGGGTSTGDISRLYITSGAGLNRVSTQSFQLRTNDGTTKTIAIWLGSTLSPITVTPSWTRVQMTASSVSDATVYLGIRGGQSPSHSDSIDLLVAEWQVEDVSGNSDQTASEHVSVSLLPAPYHGAGIDGAKWFSTNKDGTPIADALLLGRLKEPASTNTLLWCRDLTNAVWVKSNITVALTGTGLGGVTNTCSILTATANNGTILQTITAAAVAASSGFYVQRSVGTGTIEITRDGGSTWTDVTSQINSSTFSLTSILNTSVLNPSIGFRLGTSGDKIIVDYGQNETGARLWSPIATTTAAVTRNEDVLTYPSASNFSDTEGAIIASIYSDDWANISGVIGGTNGLTASGAYRGVIANDGTNTVNGPPGAPSGSRNLGIRWQSGLLQAVSNGVVEASGSYDGSFNLSSLAVAINGNLRDLIIYTSPIGENEFKGMTMLSQISGGGGAGVQLLSYTTGTRPTAVEGAMIYDVTLDKPLYGDSTSAWQEVGGASSVSNLVAQSADPSDPAAGESVMWMSDGTASGDAGDILMKITVGAVTNTITLVDFSLITPP